MTGHRTKAPGRSLHCRKGRCTSPGLQNKQAESERTFMVDDQNVFKETPFDKTNLPKHHIEINYSESEPNTWLKIDGREILVLDDGIKVNDCPNDLMTVTLTVIPSKLTVTKDSPFNPPQ